MSDHTFELPLRNRAGEIVAYTKLDICDAHLAEVRWYRNDSGYAMRIAGPRHARVNYRLHRVVVDAPPGMEVDHINGDRLDNRRANLRLVTRAEQRQNVPAYGGSSSFRGVSWHKGGRKWMASARIDGKSHYLGLFVSETEAAAVARAFRAAHMTHANEERSIREAA